MPESATIFVAATDTGVGKTLVSGLLLDFLHRRGLPAGYQKWVATGCDERIPADLALVAELAGLRLPPTTTNLAPASRDCLDLELAVPYRFRLPASPHLAAATEGRQVEPERLKKSLHQALQSTPRLVVEGVGGLLVPLNREVLLIDLLAELRLPVLLVARSGLGTINHTLLSLEALRRRQLPVTGVIFCDEAPDLPEWLVADNLQTIAAQGRVPVLGRLPRRPDLRQLRDDFQAIGQELLVFSPNFR